uniref:Microfibril associated protein 5 n=2 Tax=Oncorhynchus kisutch TaxID=8019 RepID=A0A8C7DHI2_ONCKI
MRGEDKGWRRRRRRGWREKEGKGERTKYSKQRKFLDDRKSSRKHPALTRMGSLPIALLLCGFHALTAVAQAPQAEVELHRGDWNEEEALVSVSTLPPDCREETYPCTRMYSVHRPIKRCIHSLCLYSLPRVYVINKEICVRTVCQQDEYLKAELCRERSGWPKRFQRSTTNKKRCHNLRGNPKTWENKA